MCGTYLAESPRVVVPGSAGIAGPEDLGAIRSRHVAWRPLKKKKKTRSVLTLWNEKNADIAFAAKQFYARCLAGKCNQSWPPFEILSDEPAAFWL
jgi:hypothetical protein